DSPYNTYMYAGLPPGPICIPSISSVDAVLNAEDHDFLFFCAKDDLSGYHVFARSITQHNRNARRYRKAIENR
ncbi:MAG: endolytic transglycosylase MltG, partial [Bacteroidales bacterium]|nr:endolytic transglycosylase MltG [Bacteroidales bacterium]